MHISSLALHSFRNITQASLTGLAPVNLIHGVNGSGKTSLLEAVYTLSMTRSFRSRKTRHVVKDGCTEFVVRGQVHPDHGLPFPIAVRRSLQDKALVKVAGSPVRSFGELSGLLPTQLINPGSFDLLEGGPGNRRHFLDWPMFHVKHSGFFAAWSAYRKALNQRNALLRRGKIQATLLEPWSLELAKAGSALDEIRSQAFAGISPLFNRVCESLAAEYGVDFPELKLSYSPGWDKSKSLDLALALDNSLAADLQQGFTRIGPHRADIKLRLGGVDAAERLSRGQIKTVVCALKIAQARWLKEQHGIKSLFLIDDLAAELDGRRRQALLKEILSLSPQLFITSITAAELADDWFLGTSIKRFHVEHGEVHPTPLDND